MIVAPATYGAQDLLILAVPGVELQAMPKRERRKDAPRLIASFQIAVYKTLSNG
jgi:hypothetical protein